MKAFVMMALNTDEGNDEHHFAKGYLYGWKINQACGQYKGVKERSYQVFLNDESNPPIRLGAEVQRLSELAANMGQESILLVDRAGNATLIYTHSHKQEYIGKWTKVVAGDAFPTLEEDFTHIDGEYYQVL